MGLILDFSDGQTPLEEDEKNALIIKTISTRGELDEFEQQNIEQAIIWAIGRRFEPVKILTENFVKRVHLKMFSEVWKWAGKFRSTNKNLGVDKLEIGIELRKLLDDTNYWVENKVFDADEIAVRFKHRIVTIHCFTNGNGRHSRLMADIIIKNVFDLPVFSWGTKQLNKTEGARSAYHKAIKAADKGEYVSLIKFARSYTYCNSKSSQ